MLTVLLTVLFFCLFDGDICECFGRHNCPGLGRNCCTSSHAERQVDTNIAFLTRRRGARYCSILLYEDSYYHIDRVTSGMGPLDDPATYLFVTDKALKHVAMILQLLHLDFGAE